MFLRESTVTYWLSELTAGRVTEKTAPAWLKPFIKGTPKNNTLDIADKTIDSVKMVTRFGRSGLQLNQKLDGIVSESMQLASAIEEMSATAHEIELLGERVLERAQHTCDEANRGNEALTKLVRKLDAIESSVKKVGSHAEKFVEQTKSIIKLTTTVNEIADQTNLLALNAAIEAARAGEYGRGFSVVADEVRGLARRSAEAASEIESIVSGVVSGANNVEHIVQDTITILENSHDDRAQLVQTISDASSAASDNVDATSQIASAATEQAAVSLDMARNVQSTSDGINESSEIFKGIFNNIEQLRDLQSQSLGYFDASDSKILLRLAKSDHMIWVDKVIRFALFNQNNMKESELKDHTQCRLGQFLESDKAQTYKGMPRFKELYDNVHPKVHSAGIKIYNQAKTKKDFSSIQSDVDELLMLSETVISILDELLKT